MPTKFFTVTCVQLYTVVVLLVVFLFFAHILFRQQLILQEMLRVDDIDYDIEYFEENDAYDFEEQDNYEIYQELASTYA